MGTGRIGDKKGREIPRLQARWRRTWLPWVRSTSRTEEGKDPQWRSEVSPLELCLRQEADALLILFIALVKHPDQKQLGGTGVYLASFPGHKPSLKRVRAGAQDRKLEMRTMEKPCLLGGRSPTPCLGKIAPIGLCPPTSIIKTAFHRRAYRSL